VNAAEDRVYLGVSLYDGVVRSGLFFCVAIGVCQAATAADLQKEDIRSIQETLRKTDASLDSVEAVEEKPIDATRSMIVVSAWAGPARAPQNAKVGVFVVSGPQNRVQFVLDVFPESEAGVPGIGELDTKSARLHFDSDYGLYQGSIKYFYDLSERKPPVKIRYGLLALMSSSVRDGSLVYSASSFGWSQRHATITVIPATGDALPAYRIADAPAPPDAVAQPVSLRLADGRMVIVSNTPPGQPNQPAGIAIIDKSGTREFYPAPVPTVALYRKLRLTEQPPGEIESEIGPVVMGGSTIWFANKFYDGEGTSGVGAVGAFDVRTHRFEMKYLPEIAAWSGSAIRLDGDSLWIGLMRQPEGAAFSGGLLHYNPGTGLVTKYKIPDYIHTIDRFGDAIYCGTANGLYMIRGGEVTHTSFEPDATGKLTAIGRTSSSR
jgi:hypothetical protein